MDNIGRMDEETASCWRPACIHTHSPHLSQSLLGKSTREAMISWLAAAIDGNEERGKMQMDIQKAASHGGGGGGEDWWRGERGPSRDRGRWTYTKRHHMVGGGGGS